MRLEKLVQFSQSPLRTGLLVRCPDDVYTGQNKEREGHSQRLNVKKHTDEGWMAEKVQCFSADENRTKEFLHWVEKALKHREIVDVMLLDPGLKVDLLRLHHQAFEAQCHSNMSARLETFQLFTNIMIHLIESHGHLPELHQAVVSACLPKATNDHSRLGKSLSPYL